MGKRFNYLEENKLHCLRIKDFNSNDNYVEIVRNKVADVYEVYEFKLNHNTNYNDLVNKKIFKTQKETIKYCKSLDINNDMRTWIKTYTHVSVMYLNVPLADGIPIEEITVDEEEQLNIMYYVSVGIVGVSKNNVRLFKVIATEKKRTYSLLPVKMLASANMSYTGLHGVSRVDKACKFLFKSLEEAKVAYNKEIQAIIDSKQKSINKLKEGMIQL